MPFAALLLALAPAPASPAAGETLLCEERVIEEGRVHATAAIDIDADFAVVDATMFYSAWALEAAWTVRGGDIGRFRTLKRIRFDHITLPHEAVFPVTVVYLIDGREVARGSFAEPSSRVVHSQETPAPALAGPPRTKQFYPGVELTVQASEASDPCGAARAELIATSAAGERIGHTVLALPDWETLAERGRAGFAALETERMQRRCLTQPMLIVTGDEHGSRRRR